jgi:hypothetical protein
VAYSPRLEEGSEEGAGRREGNVFPPGICGIKSQTKNASGQDNASAVFARSRFRPTELNKFFYSSAFPFALLSFICYKHFAAKYFSILAFRQGW